MFEAICRRERCIATAPGRINGSGKVVLRDRLNPGDVPVDLDLERATQTKSLAGRAAGTMKLKVIVGFRNSTQLQVITKELNLPKFISYTPTVAMYNHERPHRPNLLRDVRQAPSARAGVPGS